MEKLACDFAQFFDEKITKIHDSLCDNNNPAPQSPDLASTTSNKLSSFELVREADVLKIIQRSAIKSCSLDPNPAKSFRNILPGLVPIITSIVNLSIET